ncbi:hypothetical protein B9Z19DRAFT_1083047 [Tuber borchii]|uniref:Uncharacterized protein n=1 Tax=Tuber borchii TaxID=42251 RepID=A0A2T6ZTT6_TUBBO|nr:hypothetical protein B9Z19DRAFT_1083047 [Tuber borchii]
MRSRSPFTTAFYAIPSVHRQKDVSIRAFSMALQSPLKGDHYTSQIPGALGMRSRSPFTTAFYAIPSAHRQKDIPIRAFSMALQSLLKGESLCRVFLDIWKALTLKPDSWGVRHAIAKPFDDGVLCHPVCPPPKGRPHTSISHGATEFSEGGVLMPGFLSADFIARFRGR